MTGPALTLDADRILALTIAWETAGTTCDAEAIEATAEDLVADHPDALRAWEAWTFAAGDLAVAWGEGERPGMPGYATARAALITAYDELGRAVA